MNSGATGASISKGTYYKRSCEDADREPQGMGQTNKAKVAQAGLVAPVFQRNEPAREIQQVFVGKYPNERLAIRKVQITPVSDNEPGSTKEPSYLQSKHLDPRPVTFTGLNLPVSGFGNKLRQKELNLALRISEEKLLYLYKRNASTSEFEMNPYDRGRRDSKALPASFAPLYDKLHEMQARRISLYPEMTSGHIDADGQCIPGKKKRRYFASDSNASMKHNEAIITGYTPENIMSVVISDGTPIITDLEGTIPGLLAVIKNKEVLERGASLQDIPIAFYDSTRGTITRSYALDELLPQGKSVHNLSEALGELHSYCLEFGIPTANLNRELWQLEPKRLFARIFQCASGIGEAESKKTKALNRQLIELARKGELNTQKYLDLFKQGANPNVQVLERTSDYTNEVVQVGLLQIIGIFKTKLENSYEFERYAIERNISDRRSFLLSYWQELADATEALLQQGAIDASAIKLSYQQIASSPLVCAMLIRHGALIVNEVTPDVTFANIIDTVCFYRDLTADDLIGLIGPFCQKLTTDYSPEILDENLTDKLKFDLEYGYFHWPDLRHELILRLGGTVESSVLSQLEKAAPDHARWVRAIIDSDEARGNRERWQTLYEQRDQQSTKTGGVPPQQHSPLEQLFSLSELKIERTDRLDDIAQQVLDHYYRPAHPGQIMKRVFSEERLGRVGHGMDHVVRTMRLNQALSGLFCQFDDQYQRLFMHKDMETLLPLAMLYHDVVAEVEPKADEERRAAELFTVDMTVSGFNPATIELVASALRNKNTDTMPVVESPFTADKEVPEQEQLLRRLLRLPDSIDITRVYSIPENFPESREQSENQGGFDVTRLDLDLKLKTNSDFMSRFNELMVRAVELASVTGGLSPSDNRPGLGYAELHGLRPLDNKVNEVRKKHIFAASNACQAVDDALDDNVRRFIARNAGVKIIGDYQLRQIVVPELSLLEKFQLKQPGVFAKLQSEINRIRQHTFLPPIGSVTHDLINSKAAKKRLRGRGLELASAVRQRGDKVVEVHVLNALDSSAASREALLDASDENIMSSMFQAGRSVCERYCAIL
jgi:hypothetical protein